MNSRLLGRIRCHESDRGSDQWSIPNAQFSSEVDVGLRNVPPMQDKIALSDQLVLQAGSHTCGGFSFRMRIENWELNIGQILPSLHSAKLFLREPLGQGQSRTGRGFRFQRRARNKPWDVPLHVFSVTRRTRPATGARGIKNG